MSSAKAGINMVSFHPDSRFLTDFASGSLATSEAICVAAHLEFCAKCRAHVQQLSDLGAQIMTRIEPEEAVDADDEGFARLMQKIDDDAVHQQAEVPAPVVSAAPAQGLSLPRVVQKLAQGSIQSLNWVQLGKSLRIAPVNVGDGVRQTSLYDIRAGGQMPEHEHRGEEITVLLKGSFSDAEGKYVRGDFVVRHAGEKHQPTATMDTDCICLVSLERPVKPSSIWYRLLEPFVQFRLSGFSN
ncbi:ChrR family anti-sigma-E factor [Pseudohongiella spirulinae]|nr:ChrR family anti-sigma-E factor [Pseudohongiella spirulinae]